MPERQPSDLRGKRVLFADDELHFIEALLETAKAEGCEVLTCRNASDAIRIATTQPIDCLVIDIMMAPGADLPSVDPQKAGLAAIDAILLKNPKQPIICLSVISDQSVIHDLKRKNVLFLRKGETSLRKAWQVIESKITGIYRGL